MESLKVFERKKKIFEIFLSGFSRAAGLPRRQLTNISTAVADSEDEDDSKIVPETQEVEETLDDTTPAPTDDSVDVDTSANNTEADVGRVDTKKLDTLFSSAMPSKATIF